MKKQQPPRTRKVRLERLAARRRKYRWKMALRYAETYWPLVGVEAAPYGINFRYTAKEQYIARVAYHDGYMNAIKYRSTITEARP